MRLIVGGLTIGWLGSNEGQLARGRDLSLLLDKPVQGSVWFPLSLGLSILRLFQPGIAGRPRGIRRYRAIIGFRAACRLNLSLDPSPTGVENVQHLIAFCS